MWMVSRRTPNAAGALSSWRSPNSNALSRSAAVPMRYFGRFVAANSRAKLTSVYARDRSNQLHAYRFQSRVIVANSRTRAAHIDARLVNRLFAHRLVTVSFAHNCRELRMRALRSTRDWSNQCARIDCAGSFAHIGANGGKRAAHVGRARLVRPIARLSIATVSIAQHRRESRTRAANFDTRAIGQTIARLSIATVAANVDTRAIGQTSGARIDCDGFNRAQLPPSSRASGSIERAPLVVDRERCARAESDA